MIKTYPVFYDMDDAVSPYVLEIDGELVRATELLFPTKHNDRLAFVFIEKLKRYFIISIDEELKLWANQLMDKDSYSLEVKNYDPLSGNPEEPTGIYAVLNDGKFVVDIEQFKKVIH